MSTSGKWSISTDHERYYGEYATKNEAIAEARTGEGRHWVGQCVPPIQPEELFTGNEVEWWINHVVLEHNDYCGEWAEGALDTDRKERDELAAEIRPIIAAWLDRNKLRPTHWNIDPNTVEEVEMGKP